MLARTLLVWFVLLALPFQGFAAAALRCAHGVGHAPATVQIADAAVPPCHEEVQTEAQDSDTQLEQGKCGNCAACSVGALIAPAVKPAAPGAAPPGPCPPAAVDAIAAFDPDLPERPPRLLYA